MGNSDGWQSGGRRARSLNMSYPFSDVVMSAHVRFKSVGNGGRGTNMIYSFSVLFLSLSSASFDCAPRNANLALLATNELDYALHHGDIINNEIWYLILTNSTA
jgi:hypothetical protein